MDYDFAFPNRLQPIHLSSSLVALDEALAGYAGPRGLCYVRFMDLKMNGYMVIWLNGY